MKCFLVLIAALVGVSAHAYIPSSKNIFDRVVKSNPEGPLTVENDIIIFNNSEQIQLHETWAIENEQNFKIAVVGVKELKDKVSFLISFQNGIKTFTYNGSKTSERFSSDFFDRLFLLKNLNLFVSSLGSAGIYNQGQLSSNIFKRDGGKYIYTGEKNVRLARTGGLVNWYFGLPSTQEKRQPGLWIEQDQFAIRKIRYPSGAEMTVEKYSQVGKGIRIARLKQISWDGNSAEIQTNDFKMGVARLPVSFQEKVNPDFKASATANIVFDFYSRFR